MAFLDKTTSTAAQIQLRLGPLQLAIYEIKLFCGSCSCSCTTRTTAATTTTTSKTAATITSKARLGARCQALLNELLASS